MAAMSERKTMATKEFISFILFLWLMKSGRSEKVYERQPCLYKRNGCARHQKRPEGGSARALITVHDAPIDFAVESREADNLTCVPGKPIE